MFAILLGKGCKNINVELLARTILSNFNGLSGFLKAPSVSLLNFKGLGKAKVASLLAAKELVNRFKFQSLIKTQPISKETLLEISELLYLKTVSEVRECFYLVLFDTSERLIHIELLSKGSLEEVGVYPRDIVKIVFDYGAKSILISHNHPNSTANPSKEDLNLFDRLRKILVPLEIHLIDQLTIGVDGVFSSTNNSFIEMKEHVA